MGLLSTRTRAILAGFTAGLIGLAILYSVVGLADILQVLQQTDPLLGAALYGIALCWLTVWGLTLRVVLQAVGTTLSIRRAAVLFTSITFVNNITPFGQAGGEPFSAMLVSRDTDTPYETALAAVASVDTINFIPSIVFASLGLAYYTTHSTLTTHLEAATLTVASLVVGIPILGAIGWRTRTALIAPVTHVFYQAARGIDWVVPRVTAPPRAAIRTRIVGFIKALERVGENPTRLGIAIGYSALGWICLSLALWLAVLALGHSIPVAATLIIIPLGSVANMAPLPGGLGGVETALILLLVPITGLTVEVAAAAALLHRSATYWLPILLGATTLTLLETTPRDDTPA